MATKTYEQIDLRALRRRLDSFRVDDNATRALFVQAMENFLTAADYPDEVLMRSALEDAKGALGRRVADSIDTLFVRYSTAQEFIQEFSSAFEGLVVEPGEQLEELGRSISLLVSTVLGALCHLRDGPVALVRKHDIEVSNAAKLDDQIAYWEQVKANLVDCWPWTDAPLPPVDRQMVARSRAALEAGEKGEDINALIERLRSE